MLSSQASVFVRDFRFAGNTVYSTDELSKVVSQYANRQLTPEQLEEARRAVTMHYVEHGYINSGAVLPDQTVTDGIITFQVIEGKLTRINIQGNTHLKSAYIRDRIQRNPDAVLNVVKTKEKLELLQQNPNVERLNAELKPGASPGQSTLDVKVKEYNPWYLGVNFNNQQSPSVGAERIETLAGTRNLTGNSDPLAFRYTVLKGIFDDVEFAGLDDYGINYALPLNPSDTTVILDFSRSDSLVVEAPFEDLDISSETESYMVTLRQPLHRTASSEFAVFVSGAHQHNETFLGGEPFSFSPGAQDGESTVTALRIGQEWSTSNTRRAITVRSTESIGLGILDATENPDDIADSQFFAWLGQVQYIQRLGDSDVQLVLRSAVQLTPDSLLSIEQFGLGGLNTVRGYRENQLVRDNAALGSAELRIPLIRKAGRSILDLAPFLDLGYGWNTNTPVQSEFISSAGVGLLFSPSRRVAAQIYWGYPFEDFDTSGDDLQDMGFHFNIMVWAL